MHKLIDRFNAEGIDRNQKTREWYNHLLARYLDFLNAEGTALHTSGPSAVTRYLAYLREKGFSWSMRNGSHTALRVFYRWLKARGYVEIDPFQTEEIKRPRRPRRIRVLPTLVSVQTVLDTIREDGSAQAVRDYALILFLIDGGLRRMEVINLNVRNVNLLTGHVSVMVAKGDNQRWAYIEQPTIRAVNFWLNIHPKPERTAPLFIALNGRNKNERLSERTVNTILKTWSERAGLDNHLKPHDLRRIFATTFSEKGGGSKILQELLGHEHLETTEGYIVTSEMEIKRQHRQYSPINLLDL